MKNKELIICRCEEVTGEEIRQAIREGAKSADDVKRMTRAGMGLCQGRTCGLKTLQIMAEETGKDMEDLCMSRFRPPARPIPLEVMGKDVDRDEEDIAT